MQDFCVELSAWGEGEDVAGHQQRLTIFEPRLKQRPIINFVCTVLILFNEFTISLAICKGRLSIIINVKTTVLVLSTITNKQAKSGSEKGLMKQGIR